MASYENGTIINKAIAILEYLGNASHEISLQEIALSLNQSTATTHRILQNLKAEGYVHQLENKQYTLSYKVLALSGNIIRKNQYVTSLLPFMNYYASQKDCQVGFSVFYDNSIIHLVTVGKHIMYNDPYVLPGSVLPAYCTAAGKVFLSQLSEEELDQWTADCCLVPYTEHTVIDPDELKQQIHRTKEQGYGLVISELYEYVACISLPVFGKNNNVIGALNFSTLPDSFATINDKEFIEQVKGTIKSLKP